MKVIASTVLLATIAAAQPGPPPFVTCSDNVAEFRMPSADRNNCEGFSHGNTYTYPDDFKLTNTAKWYTCPESNLRVVISNGVPNHDVKVMNPNDPCITNWYVAVPLQGNYSSTITEPGAAGVQAMAINGVPTYGAQEAEGMNAVIGDGVPDAMYWYGHTSAQNNWHYHQPYAGHEQEPDETTLIAYALDGFPVFGVTDHEVDACNGRFNEEGKYQYHIQRLEAVEGYGDYCNGTSPAIQWNYIIGCFHGDLSKTVVADSRSTQLPGDCQVDLGLLEAMHMAKHFGAGASTDSWLVGSRYQQ